MKASDPAGARLGPEGATVIKSRKEKASWCPTAVAAAPSGCWSVTAVRDEELEENPVTTEYARVEEGLTPPPENPSPLLISSLLVLHLHQPVLSSRGHPKVIRAEAARTEPYMD